MKNRPDHARGERVRYVREKLLDIRTQQAFADWVGGVTRGAVANWEQGKEIGLANLVVISTKAKISLEWLAAGTGERPVKAAAQVPEEVSRELEAGRVFEMFQQLAPDGKLEFYRRLVEAREFAQSAQPSPTPPSPTKPPAR